MGEWKSRKEIRNGNRKDWSVCSCRGQARGAASTRNPAWRQLLVAAPLTGSGSAFAHCQQGSSAMVSREPTAPARSRRPDDKLRETRGQRLGGKIAPGFRSAQPRLRRLSARHAHMPCQRRALVPPIDNEIVAFRLARNRLFDGGVQKIVALGGAQRLAQVGRVFLPEAHIERAGAGDAHAIAGFRRNCG